MQKDSVYTDKILDEKARRLFANERKIKRLDGWFLIREISEEYESAHPFIPAALRKARALLRVCERIPLSLDENAVFAGTQRDAFAKSYALINPNFKVSTFNGYCDPAAVFRDIEPNEEFTEERIDKVRRLSERSEYVRRLKIVYEEAENDTREAAYFVEQVTGHLVPDFRPALRRGTHALREEAENAANECADAEKKTVFEAMDIALSCAEVLAKRYAELARRQQKTADGQRREELALLIRTLEKVPARGRRIYLRRCKVLSYCGRSCAWSRRPIRSPFPWATRTAFSNLSAPWKTRRAKRRRGCSNICSSFSTWATEVGRSRRI